MALDVARGPMPDRDRLARPSVGPADFRRAVLVVVAHPDDEVLGCGASLAAMSDVRIVHATDGAPPDGADARRHGFAGSADYARARRAEAEAALAIAGLPSNRLTSLRVPDQAAAANLVSITKALVPLLRQADVVLTHAYEGGHSDHDAVAFAVRAAASLCPEATSPALVEMPFYYGDESGWVRQRFLPHLEAGPEWERTIGGEDLALKHRMIRSHRTQAETLASFSAATERFRRAPAHDFTTRPHAGPLLYERHGWNLNWSEWCGRVIDARSALGLSGPP